MAGLGGKKGADKSGGGGVAWYGLRSEKKKRQTVGSVRCVPPPVVANSQSTTSASSGPSPRCSAAAWDGKLAVPFRYFSPTNDTNKHKQMHLVLMRSTPGPEDCPKSIKNKEDTIGATLTMWQGGEKNSGPATVGGSTQEEISTCRER